MGGILSRRNRLRVFFLTYVKVKRRLATVSSPSAKLWLAAKKL